MHFRTFVTVGIGAITITACAQYTTGTGDPFARDAVTRGQVIYGKECAECHGAGGSGGGPASPVLGTVPPDLVGLRLRNGGTFPRDFVREYVLGLTEKNDLAGPMPDFARVGLRHVYPKGGADGEVLEADFKDLLDYLEAIQE